MRRQWNVPTISPVQSPDWLNLAIVLAIATAMRVLFYSGFFGSDEVTYIETAANIASGDWRASNYIGATRYGMNLPVALVIYLFGLSEFTANLWPFLCSVGEVATVYLIARWLWGTRTAGICAGLLALLPLHVMFAGRMMADPPLAFFLTLSVALLLRAAQVKTWTAFLATGLAWGGVFWVKESVAILYTPVFLILAFYLNRITARWLWLFSGMAIAVVANCALMYLVAGNPLHIFAVIKAGLGGYSGWVAKTSPWYYFNYLFLDIRHTFLLGFLAVGGMFLYALSSLRTRQTSTGAQFVVLWVLLMVGMFSFAIVSVSPVKLIMKQTNYMLIFCGPLALLAGWFLSELPRKVLVPLGTVVALGSVVLAAFEQQAIAVFTANSRAVHVFLRDHPNAFLVGTTNNQRAVNFYSMMENKRELRSRVITFAELATAQSAGDAGNLAGRIASRDVHGIFDLQTIDWGYKPGGIRKLADIPKCWVTEAPMIPAALGSGSWVVKGMLTFVKLAPESVQKKLLEAVQPIASPLPAYQYRIEPACLMGAAP